MKHCKNLIPKHIQQNLLNATERAKETHRLCHARMMIYVFSAIEHDQFLSDDESS